MDWSCLPGVECDDVQTCSLEEEIQERIDGWTPPDLPDCSNLTVGCDPVPGDIVGDPLPGTTSSLIRISSISNPTVRYGEAYAAAWRITTNELVLPVSVSLSNLDEGLGACSVDQVSVDDVSAGNEAKDSKATYRLYPTHISEKLQEFGANFPDSIVVQVEGSAPSDAGLNGYDVVTCDLDIPIVASTLTETENRVLSAVVRAVPPPIVSLDFGAFVGSEQPHHEVAPVPAIPASFELRGLDDQFQVGADVVVSFAKHEDQFWDTDFVRVQFTDGSWKHTAKVNEGKSAKVSSPDYMLSNGESKRICAIAELHDESLIGQDVKDSAMICSTIRYIQVEAGSMAVDVVKDVCRAAATAVLEGRLPSVKDAAGCVMSPSATTANGWHAFPTDEGYLVLPLKA